MTLAALILERYVASWAVVEAPGAQGGAGRGFVAAPSGVLQPSGRCRAVPGAEAPKGRTLHRSAGCRSL